MSALAEPRRDRYRAGIEDLTALADVRFDGERPWDITVHDPRLFRRIAAQGSLGLGEAYMDGWWDCERLDELFDRLLSAQLDRRASMPRLLALAMRARLTNPQRASRAFEIGRHHYDIGNDLYRRMLDRRMIYSCGYWRDAGDLDAAQEAKLDLVCRKLQLAPGQRVLDIGCGWGGAAAFAAERYGVEVVGVTVSERQVELARETCAGLPVDIRLQDYRDVDERFDRVYSIGMFEHVGSRNYRTYFEVVRRCLPEDGLSLLHTIGSSVSVTTTDPWIGRYIFPNSMLPSAQQIGGAIERLFVIEDWHSFGADYDTTLMGWHRNFAAAWPELRERYGERFGRMWRYFLLACAGSFRARKNQLWQIVLSPRGVRGGYRAPR
jgi:cyclopropane-fatty-acyl-phospholipid synthase